MAEQQGHPHVVIRRGTDHQMVYLEIDGTEFALEPGLAQDVGEALYKTGCDAAAMPAGEPTES